VLSGQNIHHFPQLTHGNLSGRLFGSAMTFGSVGQASAPGQIAVRQLREMMNILS
jgi:3-dehydroquinate dehydratase